MTQTSWEMDDTEPEVQTQLALDLGVFPGLPDEATTPLPVFHLGVQSATITGVVLVLNEGHTIEFRWRRPVAIDHSAPLAFGLIGDTEPASIWSEGVCIGQATLAQTACALLTPGGTLQGSAVDVGTVLFCSLPMFSEQRRLLKKRLIATLAGPVAPVLALLLRQGLDGAVIWKHRSNWREMTKAFDQLAAAGLENFTALVLRGGRPPTRKVSARLNALGDDRLTSLFIRIATATAGAEREWFDQAVARGLKHLFKVGTWCKDDHHLLVRATSHVLMTAERMAYLQSAVASRLDLPSTALRTALSYPARVEPLRRSILCAPGGDRVRPAPLLAWVGRCALELERGLATPADVDGFEAEQNEVLEAVLARLWTCAELHSRPWAQLVNAAWTQIRHAPVLPEAVWAFDMPVGSSEKLAGVGIEVSPIVSTDMLRKEASDMGNCLASSFEYLTGLIEGRYRIFAIRGKVRATMQLVFEDGTWHIRQFMGPFNKPLATQFAESDAAWWQALREFANVLVRLPGPGGGTTTAAPASDED